MCSPTVLVKAVLDLVKIAGVALNHPIILEDFVKDWNPLVTCFFLIIEETTSSWSQENLALYRLAVASSDLSADFAAARAVDGLFVTRWSPVSTEQNPWISVDLGEVHALSHVVLLWGEFYPTSCWVDLGGVVPFFFCFFVG